MQGASHVTTTDREEGHENRASRRWIVLIIVGDLVAVSVTLMTGLRVDDALFGRESRGAGGLAATCGVAGLLLLIIGIGVIATGREERTQE